MQRLGIIAGRGNLPRQLIEACRAAGRPFFVLGLKGQTEAATVAGTEHAWTRLGAAEEGFKILKAEGVDTLVMAGSIRRPSLAEMRPDFRTLQVFARLGLAAFGDDSLLSAVTQELEKEGFSVIGAHEVDAGLLTPEGVLGAVTVPNDSKADVEFGIIVTKTLGRLDVGQGAVVQQGVVLGIEALEGTDALIDRCRGLRRRGRGGVLVKSCKPQQDRRVDLPTVGVRTVRKAFEAGLAGIAIEAGASLLLDRKAVIDAANKLGLFIVGFPS